MQGAELPVRGDDAARKFGEFPGGFVRFRGVEDSGDPFLDQLAQIRLQLGKGPKSQDASDALDDFLLAKAEVQTALGVEEEKSGEMARQESIAQLFEMLRVL